MLNSFLERGGLWVVCQGTLMLGVLGLSYLYRSTNTQTSMIIFGSMLMSIGAYFGIAGARALNKNLTPYPKPMSSTILVRHGIYARVRHPLYTSVELASMGWAIMLHSWPAVACSLCLALFFVAKAKNEERWLQERFPDYTQYAKETWRFVPWIF